MRQLVECVPNISEGRDRSIIESVVSVIEDVEQVKLLDVDPGADTNRTVITFIGPPSAVEEAAFRVVAKASELIDMAHHSGAHPRHGATDVCPFVPVSGVTMDECVELARRVGKRIGVELEIPVYLYENAALIDARRNLSHCRQGEYEALEGKLGKPEWKPDFGPASFDGRVARSGATNVGARRFLVAYNINLNTRSRKIAHDIALDVREGGRFQRDDRGRIVRDQDGLKLRRPGSLQAVKGIGWHIPEYDRSQLSMNLVDTSITKPHEAFEEVRDQARKRGVRVTGSELVGLVPEQDLLEAGRHYLKRSGLSAGIPRSAILETAIQSLGLRDLGEFDPAEKVVEYKAGLGDGPLVRMTNREFLDEVSSDSPAPGGGSIAALCGAQAAALLAMVANLTAGKKGYETQEERVKELAEIGQDQKDLFISAIDRDTEAFEQVMATFRLPKKTADQKRDRELATAAATRQATSVPLEVLELVPAVVSATAEIAEIGNVNSLSDAGVAALTARACAEGAYYNVLVNLDSLSALDSSTDPSFAANTLARAQAALEDVEKLETSIRSTIRQRLEAALGPAGTGTDSK